MTRILPVLEIETRGQRCGAKCLYLSVNIMREARCELFTGALNRDGKGYARADECQDAEVRHARLADQTQVAS